MPSRSLRWHKPDAHSLLVLAALIALGSLLGHRLSSSTVWVSLRASIYQHLTSSPRHAPTPAHTAVVLLDDADFWTSSADPSEPALAGRLPANRAFLARLVSALDAAGAPVIALDFDFRLPSPRLPADLPEYADEDAALARAIQQACAHGHRVVLGSALLRSASGDVTHAASIFPPSTLGPCATTGYLQLPLDIRRLPLPQPLTTGAIEPSFALAAAFALDPSAAVHIIRSADTAFPYSRFLSIASYAPSGSAQTRFSGRDILSASPATLTALLQNRIVLIGANWHTLAAGQGTLTDTHPSPAGAVPGFLLHANFAEAVINRSTVRPFPEAAAEALDIALVLVLAAVGLLDIHFLWKWTAVLALVLFVLSFTYLFVQTFGLFLDFFFPLLFLAAHAAYDNFREWRRSTYEASR